MKNNVKVGDKIFKNLSFYPSEDDLILFIYFPSTETNNSIITYENDIMNIVNNKLEVEVSSIVINESEIIKPTITKPKNLIQKNIKFDKKDKVMVI